MEWIAHRINTQKELCDLPEEYGVEIDLRDYHDRLILSHDPFTGGEDFEEYLKSYHHGLMILNIKSERIEFAVLELLKKYNVTRYFFLDSSFPMMVQLSEQGEDNLAVRYSEFESMESVMAMRGRARWIWVDCFNRFILDAATAQQFIDAGFQICLVSPCLQGRPQQIGEYVNHLKEHQVIFHAVCAKQYNMEQWREFF